MTGVKATIQANRLRLFSQFSVDEEISRAGFQYVRLSTILHRCVCFNTKRRSILPLSQPKRHRCHLGSNRSSNANSRLARSLADQSLALLLRACPTIWHTQSSISEQVLQAVSSTVYPFPVWVSVNRSGSYSQAPHLLLSLLMPNLLCYLPLHQDLIPVECLPGPGNALA